MQACFAKLYRLSRSVLECGGKTPEWVTTPLSQGVRGAKVNPLAKAVSRFACHRTPGRFAQ
jgi:hypothetical protein